MPRNPKRCVGRACVRFCNLQVASSRYIELEMGGGSSFLRFHPCLHASFAPDIEHISGHMHLVHEHDLKKPARCGKVTTTNARASSKKLLYKSCCTCPGDSTTRAAGKNPT